MLTGWNYCRKQDTITKNELIFEPGGLLSSEEKIASDSNELDKEVRVADRQRAQIHKFKKRSVNTVSQAYFALHETLHKVQNF
jgi:hypothetical protein